jgi:membrane protease YdiL (CAAX protease family)
MNWKIRAEVLVRYFVLIVLTSTTPVIGALLVWLYNSRSDEIVANLSERLVYLVTVVIILLFLQKYKLTKVKQGKVNTIHILGFLIFALMNILIFVKVARLDTLFRAFIIIFTYLAAGFSEELLYRGYMLKSLQIDLGFSRSISNIIQAILFAFLGHFGLPFLDNLIWRLPLGLALGGVMQKTDSLFLVSSLHAEYDIIMWYYF